MILSRERKLIDLEIKIVAVHSVGLLILLYAILIDHGLLVKNIFNVDLSLFFENRETLNSYLARVGILEIAFIYLTHTAEANLRIKRFFHSLPDVGALLFIIIGLLNITSAFPNNSYSILNIIDISDTKYIFYSSAFSLIYPMLLLTLHISNNLAKSREKRKKFN